MLHENELSSSIQTQKFKQLAPQRAQSTPSSPLMTSKAPFYAEIPSPLVVFFHSWLTWLFDSHAKSFWRVDTLVSILH